MKKVKETLSFVKYFGYLSPSFRIIEILEFIFVGTIGLETANTTAFYRFLIAACILAIITSVAIYKIDGKDIQKNNERCTEAITNVEGITQKKIIEKPINKAFVLLVMIDIISVIAAGYNIINEMGRVPTENNWLHRNKNRILTIIAVLLLLTVISKCINTYSLQTRENYNTYERLFLDLTLIKILDEEQKKEEKEEEKEKEYQQIQQEVIKSNDEYQKIKQEVIKSNGFEVSNKDLIQYSTEALWSKFEYKCPEKISKLRSLDTDNIDVKNKYKKHINIISFIVTSALLAIYGVWGPSLVPNLPTYIYLAFGALLGLIIITQLNKVLDKQLDELQHKTNEFHSKQSKILKDIDADDYRNHLSFAYNVFTNDEPGAWPPGSRILPKIITPIFNFLAIAFPIMYVIHIFTSSLGLPLFYQSPITAIITILITIILSGAYARIKTRGALQDQKNKLVIEHLKTANELFTEHLKKANESLTERHKEADQPKKEAKCMN